MTYNSDEHECLEAEWLEAESTADLQGEMPTAPNLSADAIPIPLAREVHQVAQDCAVQQRTPEKTEQVRRNLLAVLSLWNYLRIQGYVLALETSDCWNPILRQMNDVADLVISGIGRIECRVFAPDQELCPIPEEVQVDRIGYVAVQFDAENRWAWLLGFVPALNPEAPVEGIRRAELYSMDEFGAHLHRVQLLQQILQEKQAEEPWEPELREAVVAQLERLFLTATAPQRPVLAEQAIAPWIEGEWEAEPRGEAAEPSTLAGTGSREQFSQAEIGKDTSKQLRSFLRDVFDELIDALEIDALEEEE